MATEQDFRYSFERRKAELLEHWRGQQELRAFWDDRIEIDGQWMTHTEYRSAAAVTDADFCTLCQHVQIWVARENASKRPKDRMSRSVIGLRPGEDYTDPLDAPRIATIYNGLYGRAQFVPFRKGDPEGNRWLDNEPLFIDWSYVSVGYLSTSKASRWQGCDYFLIDGIAWTRGANHVPIKAKRLDPGIMDVNAMKLRPLLENRLGTNQLLSLLNSNVFSFLLKKFIAHTWMAQISDLRMMPINVPTEQQAGVLSDLAAFAMSAKRHEFAGTTPDDNLVSRVRQIGEGLRQGAPIYLRPSAQGLLLETPADCLEVIEKAVNWEAEKLYGVEGLGPFDEF